MWQLDVQSAFPNAILPDDVEIYMTAPEELGLPRNAYLK